MDYVTPYETNFGDWTYTQVYVFYQVWKHNYGWINEIPEDVHILLVNPQKKLEYDTWLKDVWVKFSYPIRSLWVYNQLRLLKYPHLLGNTCYPIPKTKPQEPNIPDYIVDIERNSLGDIVSYKNKHTGVTRVGSRELNLNAGRRFGKSFMSFTLIYGLSQWNFFHDQYSATIFLPTGDSVNRISTDINSFYKEKTLNNNLQAFNYFSSLNKFTSSNGFRLELWTVNTDASTRGSTSLLNIIDEAGFMNDLGLIALENATQPTLKQYDAIQITTTSPAEDELNVLLKTRCYDVDNYFSLSLPTIANVSQNSRGDFILSPTTIAGDMRKVLKEQGSIGSAMFLGIPLSDTERTLYKPKHFVRLSAKELDDSYPEHSYDSIRVVINNTNISKEDREREIWRYNNLIDGGKPSQIEFSVITSDISFSGKGDSTVFLHMGFSKNSNFYILDVFKKPLAHDMIPSEFSSFLLRCLNSPYGEKLRACYMEVPHSTYDVNYYNTLKSHVTRGIELRRVLLSSSLNTEELESFSRLEALAKDVNIYLIHAHGGSVSKGNYASLQEKSQDMFNTLESTKMVAVSGSKSQRAESAINTLNRYTSSYSDDTSKIVFFPKYNNRMDIDKLFEECYKEAISFIRTGGTRKKQEQRDDFVDALTYALMVYDSWNTLDTKKILSTGKAPLPFTTIGTNRGRDHMRSKDNSAIRFASKPKTPYIRLSRRNKKT